MVGLDLLVLLQDLLFIWILSFDWQEGYIFIYVNKKKDRLKSAKG